MDERTGLLIQVLDALSRGKFEVSEKCGRTSCFDIFARREVLLLLIKILANIDSMSEFRAREMMCIAKMLSASPIVVGSRTRSSNMEEGMVYKRYGVPAVTPETFEDVLLNEIFPIMLSARGGYYVRIDGAILRELRKAKNLSLGDVAENIGVSRRTVYKYEQESAGATFETALRLEEFLDESIVKPIEIFTIPKKLYRVAEVGDELEKKVLERLVHIGFQVYPTKKAPFSALTKSEKEVMLTKVVKFGLRKVLERARILKSISETVMAGAFFITDSSRDFRENIGGIPVIKKEELENIDKSGELVDTLIERTAQGSVLLQAGKPRHSYQKSSIFF